MHIQTTTRLLLLLTFRGPFTILLLLSSSYTMRQLHRGADRSHAKHKNIIQVVRGGGVVIATDFDVTTNGSLVWWSFYVCGAHNMQPTRVFWCDSMYIILCCFVLFFFCRWSLQNSVKGGPLDLNRKESWSSDRSRIFHRYNII